MKAPEASAARDRWVAYARGLAVFTIAFNVLEGLVSMGFGWAEGSLSLFGFGADSFIEVGSALLILWRLGTDGDTGRRLRRERNATKGIGWLLVFLALGTTGGALLQLEGRRHPGTTVPGLLVALVSVGIMFWLWKAKARAGTALDSGAVKADAACSLACIQLSGVLFAGSLVFVLAPGLWWADAAAALLLSGLIGREGVATIRAASRADFNGGCGCH